MGKTNVFKKEKRKIAHCTMGDMSPGRQNSPILPEKVREDLKEEVTRCDS